MKEKEKEIPQSGRTRTYWRPNYITSLSCTCQKKKIPVFIPCLAKESGNLLASLKVDGT